MSIYATLWEIKVPRSHDFDDDWIEVYAQAVPPHIGHPAEYPESDPYADFLPPVVMEYDSNDIDQRCPNRAVVIVQRGRDRKLGQQYADPLIVMTGKEYERTTFANLLDRIHQAIGWDDSVVGVFLRDGKKQIIRKDKGLQ